MARGRRETTEGFLKTRIRWVDRLKVEIGSLAIERKKSAKTCGGNAKKASEYKKDCKKRA